MQRNHRAYRYLDDYFRTIRDRQQFDAGYRSLIGKWLHEGINETQINGARGYFPHIEFTSLKVLETTRRVETALYDLLEYDANLYYAVVLNYVPLFIRPTGQVRFNANYYAHILGCCPATYHVYLSRGLDWLHGTLTAIERKDRRARGGVCQKKSA